MSTQYSPRSITSGLVASVDAANPKSYPGSGTIWTDLSGNGNHGQLINGPLTYNTQNNGSLSFDGIDDYADLGSGSSLVLTNAMTIQLWTNLSANAAETILVTRSIVSGSVNPTDWRFMTKVYANGIGLNWGWRPTPNGSDRTEFTGSMNLALSTWHNLAVTFNGTKLRLYYSGSLDAEYDEAVDLTNVYPIRFGQGIGGAKVYLNGKLAMVSIYNRVLSPDEILQNFNATRGRFGV